MAQGAQFNPVTKLQVVVSSELMLYNLSNVVIRETVSLVNTLLTHLRSARAVATM